MEIADRTKERSTVILAVLTLVVIGLSLLMSTRQTFRHQREAEEQHLFLTTRAVLLAIESSVRRGPVREGSNRLSPRTAEFFQELEQDGDVLFVGIIEPDGQKLLTAPVHGDTPIALPPYMVRELAQQGEWHGRLQLDAGSVYVYGKRLAPLRGMPASLREEMGPPGYLVVGVDLERYLGAFAGFRKNVVFQALYILAAALFTWGLGVSFLSRREQARKAAALELFQARLLDNLPDGLITIDKDGFVSSANPAALHIVKRGAKDILGKAASVLPDKLGALAVTGNENTARNDWRHVNYERAHLEVLALPLSDDQQNARVLIIRDRTQLRTLEKNLANAEKLAAVGTLAAGIAHEVRNPLSSLRGFAQYFVKKLAGRVPEEEYAKTMVREADRLNRVITDLLFLARPKAVMPKEVRLDALMREISTLLRFDLEQKGLAIALRLDAPVVFADEDGLKQALLNLLLNSLDALEEKSKSGAGGQSQLQMPLLPELPVPAAKACDVHENPVEVPPLGGEGDAASDAFYPLPLAKDEHEALQVLSGCAQGGVWVEVRDTGCGMTEEQQKQAFEAFFTAKERGTGLGLALVQRTMHDHGGSAHIASECGRGCAIRLFFPDTKDDGRADAAGDAATALAPETTTDG